MKECLGKGQKSEGKIPGASRGGHKICEAKSALLGRQKRGVAQTVLQAEGEDSGGGKRCNLLAGDCGSEGMREEEGKYGR